MQSEHHDLVHEFPEFREKIHDLKISDEHFKNLFDEYHKLDREVYRVEYDIEPRSETALEDLKKRRLALKDELYHILKHGVPKPGTVET
ncbi:MAG: YdcH family protein [Candidatus Kuenenia sp.]|nr:YdcH family protein [Candidatus Kuenenia hertensis]